MPSDAGCGGHGRVVLLFAMVSPGNASRFGHSRTHVAASVRRFVEPHGARVGCHVGSRHGRQLDEARKSHPLIGPMGEADARLEVPYGRGHPPRTARLDRSKKKHGAPTRVRRVIRTTTRRWTRSRGWVSNRCAIDPERGWSGSRCVAPASPKGQAVDSGRDGHQGHGGRLWYHGYDVAGNCYREHARTGLVTEEELTW